MGTSKEVCAQVCTRNGTRKNLFSSHVSSSCRTSHTDPSHQGLAYWLRDVSCEGKKKTTVSAEWCDSCFPMQLLEALFRKSRKWMLFGCVAGFRGWSLTTSTDNVGELATQRPIWAWPSTFFLLGFSSVESPKGWALWFVLREAAMKAHHEARYPVLFFAASLIIRFFRLSILDWVLPAECFARNVNWHVSGRNPLAIFSWRPTSLGRRPPKGIEKGSDSPIRHVLNPLLSRWRWPGRWRFSCGGQMSDKLLRGAPQFYRLMNRRHLWWQTFFANTHRTIFSILSTSASGAMSGGAGDNSPLALVPLVEQGISEKYLGYINYDEIKLDMISKRDLHLTLRRT